MIKFERPIRPMLADCGHLCNCFLFTAPDGRQAYDHDIFPVDGLNYENGTECGPCYHERMERATAGWTINDVARAFGGNTRER